MMKKQILVITVVIILPLLTCAQFTFEKAIGSIDNDWGYSIDQCDDNGYFIVGHTDNFYFEYPDIYVVKTDVAGEVLWTDTIGNPQISEWGVTGIQTFDGGYLACGYKYLNGFIVTILVKYNNAGEKVWSKLYQSQGSITPRSLIQVPDSSFVIVGNANHDTTSKYWGKYPFIMKIKSNGAFEWFNDIYLDYGYHTCNGVDLAHDGGFIVCGQYRLLASDEEDALIVKLNPDGDSILWKATVGEEYQDESFRIVKRTNDLGYIFCGSRWRSPLPFNQQANVYLVKTNHLGQILWEKSIDRGGLEYGYSLDIISNDGFIITGVVVDSVLNDDELLLIRTDAYGDTLWTKTFGGDYFDRGNSVCTTTDGGFAVGGVTKSFGAGGADIYLVKTDDFGIVTETQHFKPKETSVNCYPNPCSNFLMVDAVFPIETITIMNSSGHEFISMDIQDNKYLLNLEKYNLQAGLYYILIQGEANSCLKKVIVNP